ncbi:Sec-independent protein translocase subunit TatA/TatB [Flavobacterium aquiphilum]|uniref:Sec-independent protein translocase subunit TatA/TatB n=1 Tax=Flavobacterium aquiphilum TaxID=3003261 RepID=UPI0024808BBE|nr:twin-arginine translocase TatA/TatE family subunit [Flavobacterium aquiphilum]
MFGIGGGELVFIMFIVLMLFGSDKVPEIARTMGKAMAQLKNATNDIKSEIQKGAEANGFDQKTLDDLTGGINSEINKVKSNLLGDTSNSLNSITESFNNEVNKTAESVVSGTKNPDGTSVLDDLAGPIKRQM